MSGEHPAGGMSKRSLYAWHIATESLEQANMPRVRPSVWQWLRYAYGRRLAERHAIWVLYDLTCSSWVGRHLARLLVAVTVPVVAIALFLPAPTAVRAITAFVFGAGAVLFGATWTNELCEYRLIQAGYSWQLGAQVRAKRDEVMHWMQVW